MIKLPKNPSTDIVLPYIWNGEPVITYEAAAKTCNIPSSRLRKRFSAHRDWYVTGVNTYFLDSQEVIDFCEQNKASEAKPGAKNLRLFNRKGYMLLMNKPSALPKVPEKPEGPAKPDIAVVPEVPAVNPTPVEKEEQSDLYNKIGYAIGEQLRQLVGGMVQAETEKLKMRVDTASANYLDISKYVTNLSKTVLASTNKINELSKMPPAFQTTDKDKERLWEKVIRLEERLNTMSKNMPVEAIPASNITDKDLDARDIARKNGWFDKHMAPHFRLVYAICRECGVVINWDAHQDTADVKFAVRQSTGDEIYYSVYFTERGQKKIREHWDVTHLQRYICDKYRNNSRYGRKGDIKKFGYYYGAGKGAIYEVYDKYRRPLLPPVETGKIVSA